jgi:cytosine deaminase
VPIGAALVVGDDVLGVGRNRRVQWGSVIRHGETDCLENAGRQPAEVYRRATLFTTLSPCLMCAGTILLYGIPRLVIGENRTFEASEALLRERGVEVTVVDDPRCKDLMDRFIDAHPEVWNEDIGVPSA